MFSVFTGRSQNISFNLLQTPCNANGILDFDITGLNVPCNISIVVGNNSYSYTLNSTSDTIYGYTGAYVYIYAEDGFNDAYGSFTAPPFTYTTNSTPAVCPAMGTASVNITGGTAPFTVNWYDFTTQTLVATGSPASVPAGTYSVMITDANGCMYGSTYGGDSATYVPYSSGMSVTTSASPANCTNGTATVNTVTGGTSPYTYLWSNGLTTQAISGLVTGLYSVDITDAQGCLATQYVYVPQSVSITLNPVTNPATCLQSNGSVAVFPSGGQAPYTYAYSNGANTQTVTGLATGSYSVIVTDANGCHGSNNFYVAATSPIIANYSTTATSCSSPNGGSTLTINGGTAPYTVNWYTSPAQSGTTLTGVYPGTYSFTITDAAGCVRNGNVSVPVQNPMYVTISHSNSTCLSNSGSASVNVSGGTPPFTYLWSNGATTSAITGLSSGYYSCTVTDAAGCSIIKSTGITINSPLNINFTTAMASCIFSSDGSATVIPTSGTSPYTYSWSTGATTATISGVPSGHYYVLVTDAVGCTKSGHVFIPYNPTNNSCYCTLTGTVYNDANGNCIMDSGEPGLENIPVQCSGIGTSYTDANGVYTFIVPSGNYTLTQFVQPYYPLAACQSANISVTASAASNCIISNDFANQVIPVHDLHIFNTYYTPPVVGNNFNQLTIVSNDGTLTESNIQIGYKHDGQILFTSAGAPYTQLNAANDPNWYSVTSGFPTLNANDNYSYFNNYFVPTNIPLATVLYMRDTVCHQAPITDWVTDNSPWNNIDDFFPVVVASYDPNIKEVHPQGIGAQGYIPRTEETLEYVVHFQNTGTWPAQNIVVKDTLDADLDWETLQPGWSNHSYTTSMDENGVVSFSFENIYLPDSASNPTGSIGVFSYSIKIKSGLPDLTQITNTAAIYFDYNAPVITNTTMNTIADSLNSVMSLEDEKLSVTLFPNPTQNQFTLQWNDTQSGNAQVEIFDIAGKLLFTNKYQVANGTNNIAINTSGWEEGLYLVKLYSNHKTSVNKLIKQ